MGGSKDEECASAYGNNMMQHSNHSGQLSNQSRSQLLDLLQKKVTKDGSHGANSLIRFKSKKIIQAKLGGKNPSNFQQSDKANSDLGEIVDEEDKNLHGLVKTSNRRRAPHKDQKPRGPFLIWIIP